LYNELKTLKDIPEEDFLTGGSPTCSGCPAEMGLKMALKALGKNTIVVNSSSCMSLLCNYPYTPLKVPWLHSAIENAAATATGIVRALKILNRHATVICYAGDGATYDIGIGSLSGMAARGDPVLYICYNNATYANTGGQWDTATPFLANTKTTPPGKYSKGNLIPHKNMLRIMGAHGIYATSASPAFPLDYMNKVRKAQAMNAPAYIEYFSPCVPSWGYKESLGVKIAKLAVETCFWPLYEIENNKVTINYKPTQMRPVKEFLELQDRYRHLTDYDISVIQGLVSSDWKELLGGESCKKT
jgi:pyruvate ferredoxin oxidoreductase beta subunit